MILLDITILRYNWLLLIQVQLKCATSQNAFDIICSTHFSGKSIVINTMLGTMTIIHSIVNIYFFKLIVIGERATRYINSYLRLPVCSEYQELSSIM